MAKKKTTRARRVKRTAHHTAQPAAQAKARTKRSRPAAPKPVATAPKRRSAPSPAKLPASAGGAVAIPGLEMGDIQETVRGVVGYVQQNPLAAAAVAIGVGVMLTSMYWDDPARGRKRAGLARER